MSTNKQAQAIISDIRLKHGSGDAYAPIIRWDEFQVISNALEAAENRIAELSDSHSKLRDAMAGIYNTITGGGAYTPLSAILNASKRAYEESAIAAGIAVKGADGGGS
ncbi:hypothetical protein ACLEXX_02045 [Enterobacter ludwigii]|uniref:hypothetical protein n=1 Tax=Enterobacter ludwigii TaxID=299767 RepID=UPI003974BAA0